MMRLVWARGFPALPPLVAPTPMGAFGGQQSPLTSFLDRPPRYSVPQPHQRNGENKNPPCQKYEDRLTIMMAVGLKSLVGF